MSFIESTDVLWQHYFCNTCLSVKVIAAHAMPPTWHMRLVSALSAAMPISSTETEGWQATHKHTCKHHADAHSTTTPLWRARWWHRTGVLVTVFLASQHEEYNGACLARGLEGGAGRGGYRHKGNEGVRRRKLERCIVHTVHIADVSSIHLLCCKKSRSLIFFPPLLFHIVSQDVCGAEFRWLIQSTIRL